MKRIPFVISFLILSITIISAQSTLCPVFYSSALEQTEDICDQTGRNQACYGNNTINLVPFSPTTPYDFNAPGDVTNIEIIRALSLSALDENTGDWGIAMIRLLANINPQQTNDVTMLLFGDVEVESAVDHTNDQLVTTTTYVNIRRYPNTTSAVVASIEGNSTLNAMGRLSDDSWIQVYDIETGFSGWVFTDLVANFGIEQLPIVEPAQPYFGPMQAFYFSSGNHQLDCTSVPSDGLLIQTPEGVGRVTVWVNEVTIDFLSDTGATAFVQAQANDMMSIDMLEGDAYISNDQTGYVAVAGSVVTVNLDDESPKINAPQPASQWSTSGSPVGLLERPVDSAPPANTGDIASANGLTAVQYDEVVTYGYVITQSNTNQSQNTIDNTSGTNTTNGDLSSTVNGNGTSDTTTGTGDNPASVPPPDNNTGGDNSGDSGNSDGGGDDDCPGNSCNAPGHNKDDDCPGNSCNAPGQNKDKNKNK